MRLKLNENIGRRGADLWRRAGHGVTTVTDHGLNAASDQKLIEVCRQEGRCLVTLDLSFANPLRFNPADYAGIAVLRLSRRLTPDDLYEGLRTLIGGLSQADFTGKLWIIQKGRIRTHQSAD